MNVVYEFRVKFTKAIEMKRKQRVGFFWWRYILSKTFSSLHYSFIVILMYVYRKKKKAK